MGAVGTMQTMPGTLRDPGYGVRPAKDNSPAELERVGKDYLAAMGKRYDGNVPLQLAAYNAGPGVVDDWLKGSNRTGKNPNHLKLPDPRKSGVSEQEFWARIPFDETKDYVRNITAAAGQPVATGGGTGDVVDASNPDFKLPAQPEDLAKRLDKPGLRILPELQGHFAMSATQRTDLLQFRETMLNKGRTIEARAKADVADRAHDEFAMRLMGQGAALTTQDVLDRVEDGTLTGREGATWLKSIQAATEAEAARAEALANKADRDRQQEREDTATRILNTYGSDVISGKKTPAQARQELLTTGLPAIADPLVRAQVMSSAGAYLNNLESLRMDTPAARDFLATTEALEGGIGMTLQGRILRYKNKPLTMEQAQALTRIELNRLRMEGAQSIKDTGTAPKPEVTKKRLQDWLDRNFPMKPKAPSGGHR